MARHTSSRWMSLTVFATVIQNLLMLRRNSTGDGGGRAWQAGPGRATPAWTPRLVLSNKIRTPRRRTSWWANERSISARVSSPDWIGTKTISTLAHRYIGRTTRDSLNRYCPTRKPTTHQSLPASCRPGCRFLAQSRISPDQGLTTDRRGDRDGHASRPPRRQSGQGWRQPMQQCELQGECNQSLALIATCGR